LAAALSEEFHHRWDKYNAVHRHIEWLRQNVPPFPPREPPIVPESLERSGLWQASAQAAEVLEEASNAEDEDESDADDAAGATAVRKPEYYCVDGIPDGCTPFPLCMFPEFWGPNAVLAYQSFYQGAKVGFCTYSKREPPPWLRLHVPGDASSLRAMHPVPSTLNSVVKAIDRTTSAVNRFVERTISTAKSTPRPAAALPDRRFKFLATRSRVVFQQSVADDEEAGVCAKKRSRDAASGETGMRKARRLWMVMSVSETLERSRADLGEPTVASSDDDEASSDLPLESDSE
jgi:hypothetical protein